MSGIDRIPKKYTEFSGKCHEYPKHSRNALDTAPARQRQITTTDHNSKSTIRTEQERLYRPRKLFVKVGSSWEILDGDNAQVAKPYIFISYAANQFERDTDASGRMVLSDAAAQRLKQRAETLVEESNLEAYWIDFLRAPEQREATDDVHRFCDVGSGLRESMCAAV
jgi:hypothetical protein